MRPMLLSLLLLAAGATAACGGDAPKDAEGAEATVKEFHEAMDDGDYDDACDLLTDTFREKVSEEWNAEGWGDEVTDCETTYEQVIMLMRAFEESDDPGPLFDVDTMETEVDGDEATVTVGYVSEPDDPEGQVYRLVYDDGDWWIDDMVDLDEEEGGAGDSESSAPAQPSALSEPATVGDWTVEVTDVDRDAARTIRRADEFNDEAEGTFVLVTFEATYDGPERTAEVGDLNWTLTTNDQQVHETDHQATPAGVEGWSHTVRPGGTARWQVVFDVDPALLDGALLAVQIYTHEGEQYVDFQL